MSTASGLDNMCLVSWKLFGTAILPKFSQKSNRVARQDYDRATSVGERRVR